MQNKKNSRLISRCKLWSGFKGSSGDGYIIYNGKEIILPALSSFLVEVANNLVEFGVNMLEFPLLFGLSHQRSIVYMGNFVEDNGKMNVADAISDIKYSRNRIYLLASEKEFLAKIMFSYKGGVTPYVRFIREIIKEGLYNDGYPIVVKKDSVMLADAKEIARDLYLAIKTLDKMAEAEEVQAIEQIIRNKIAKHKIKLLN